MASEKRRWQMGKLQQIIDTLRIPAALPPKNTDHNLTGNYAGYRECHIEPDWLLIYRQSGTELTSLKAAKKELAQSGLVEIQQGHFETEGKQSKIHVTYYRIK